MARDVQDVLEFAGFEGCASRQCEFTQTPEPIVDTMDGFLRLQAAEQPSSSTQKTERQPILRAVGVSLSGGVDSMVIARLLAGLANTPAPTHTKAGRENKAIKLQRAFSVHAGMTIVAIHIDYCNRPESKVEADFVQKWCSAHGILCCIRKMPITRPHSTAASSSSRARSRQQYEQLTRALRFQAYKEVIPHISAVHAIIARTAICCDFR